MMKSVNRFLALVCALALTLAFSMTALAAEVEPTAFSTEDLTLSGLMLYASQEEAAALLGAPDTNKTVMLEATGESVTIWELQRPDPHLRQRRQADLRRSDCGGVHRPARVCSLVRRWKR